MKKTLWIAIVGALAASVIAASAQEVLSANAVGYIKKTLPANGALVALSVPLDSMTETSIVFGRTSIAQEAPVNAWAYFWTGASWAGGMKTTKGWAGLSNRVVASGEAFFMKGDVNDGVAREVTITGEVPADTARTRSITGGGNLTSIANPFPVDFTFGSSSIASNASVNSWAYFWTGSSWAGGMKTTKGWAGLSNRVVLAAEGFFLKEVNTAFTWTNSKPYTWP
jgi:hypothetical protein